MLRRKFIQLSAVASVWVLSGCGGSDESPSPSSPVSELISADPLSIPPLLDPQAINGVKSYELTIAESLHSFFTESKTSTYGINGTFLGPTLLLKNGDDVSIKYINNLTEDTTIHGHGMHVPASEDGGPHQKIVAGGSKIASYTVKQKACTNWYHPHLMGKTAEHVYKGLAGLIIIEDDESQALELPKTYGVDDIPLVVQDRVFDANGNFDYTLSNMDIMQGYRGSNFIINGQTRPVFSAKAGLLRLRILNGSNAGVYNFSFSDDRVFHQIATDNSFLAAPVQLRSVRLSPGERAEIIVDLSGDANQELKLDVFESIDGRSASILTINVSSDLADILSLPSVLSTTLDEVDESLVVNTRSFTLEGSGNQGNPSLTINEKSMDMMRIDERVTVDQIEVWEITNTMGMPHNFHIHATHFRILDRNGNTEEVAENEKSYKDTVFIPARERVRLLVKMTDYVDTELPYMYHCHFLEHEDAGMMGQFTVE